MNFLGESHGGYTFTRRLGEGGTAVVFLAVREVDECPVAVKVLRDARPELVRRFQNEAAVQQSLDHPHVVPVRDVLAVHGQPALAELNRREEALDSLQRAWGLFRSVGDRIGEGFTLLNLGALEREPVKASEHFRQALAVARHARSWQLELMALRNVGAAELLRGLYDRSVAAFAEAAKRHTEVMRRDAYRVSAWLALAQAGAGDLAAARAVLAALPAPPSELDALILAVVETGLGALAEPHDWRARLERQLSDLDGEPPWDLRLTATLVGAVLGEVAGGSDVGA